MEWQFTPYTIPLAISAAGSVALAIYILKNRHTAGSVSFGMLLLAAAEWTASYSLEMACTTIEDKIVFSKGLYLGVVLVPGVWFLFTLQYTGRLQRVRWPVVGLLAVELVITLTLAWSMHPLLRTVALDTSGPFTTLSIDYGSWFWVHAAYSYVLLLLGTLVLGPVVLRSPFLYRRQIGLVLIGLLAPWVGNALYISGHSPFPGLDLTPLSFIVLGAAVSWGLLRLRLFDVVPIARDTVIEDLIDGVIVLEENDRIVDLNPAAQAIIEASSATEVIGRPAIEVLANVGKLGEAIASGAEVNAEVTLGEGQQRQVYELRIAALRDRQRLSGRLVVLHNITRRKHAQEEVVRAQRLRAVGELSLGISHNLNNILTSVLGPTELIKGQVANPGLRQHAETIIAAVDRASDLVQQLGKTFQRSDGDSQQAVILQIIG